MCLVRILGLIGIFVETKKLKNPTISTKTFQKQMLLGFFIPLEHPGVPKINDWLLDVFLVSPGIASLDVLPGEEVDKTSRCSSHHGRISLEKNRVFPGFG